MGRQKAGNKAYRAVDLLTGLYDPDIERILAPHGMTDEERERGWGLLKAYAAVRKAAPAANVRYTETLRLLDAWENRWFVVCDAALAHSYPEVHAWLFNKLSRQSGTGVVLSTSVLIDRVGELERGVAELGEQAQAAAARLRERGVTSDVLSEGNALLEELQAFGPEQPQQTRSPEKETQAEQALWNWYLEWSGIARAVLQDKRLLNHIGFGKVGRPKKKP